MPARSRRRRRQERKRNKLDTNGTRTARTRSSAASWSSRRTRPTVWRASKARAEEPADDHLGQRRRRRRAARDDDHDDRHADGHHHPERDPGGERAEVAAPKPALDERGDSRRHGGSEACALLSSRPALVPWPPFTSPTSSRPSTGGASAVPSPDGITACAEVLALAEVYALMVYYHEDECDEASMPPAARDAWLAWYASTPDAPCIAICSTSQGDDVCKGCGRTFDEVQHWPEMTPAEKRATWRRITHGRQRLALQPLRRTRATGDRVAPTDDDAGGRRASASPPHDAARLRQRAPHRAAGLADVRRPDRGARVQHRRHRRWSRAPRPPTSPRSRSAAPPTSGSSSA